MNETIIVTLERQVGTFDLLSQLRDLGHLVVMQVEFNTDTQLIELGLRTATTKDI